MTQCTMGRQVRPEAGTGSHMPETSVGTSLDHRQERHAAEHAEIFHPEGWWLSA